jgi:WD40 repeat protein
MSSSLEERLERLVSHWLALRAQGQEAPLEQLCRDCPELLPELQRRVAILAQGERHSGEEQVDEWPTKPPAASHDAEGETLPGEEQLATPSSVAPPGYQILGELGRGGMGVVYKARQVSLNRTVALKMILAGGHAGAEERMRFLAEAEAIAAIRHPGIVQIHDFGTHGGLPWFALEFCEGGSLAQKLNGTPLPPREAARLVEQVARATQAAHDKGIVHRDLKPGNVLLVGQASPPDSLSGARESLTCEPKITDFGLARRAAGTGLTQTGAVMGTPSYMAPEQAEGKKQVGPPADVYALGAILYECLTGRPPFKAATAFDTIMQVVADEPVAPTQLNPKVPRDLETICLKCLRKEPVKRYATAEELARDLERWQHGEPVQARPVGLGERAAKWARRRPAVAGLLVAIVVLTGLALGVTTGLYRNAVRAEKQAEEDRDNALDQEKAARKAEGEAREQEGIARKERDKTRVENQRAEEQLERAERLLYASQIQAAQREWAAGNVALAWEYLEACRWDYRGIEHRYLYNLFNYNQTTLKGHTGEVTSVAISNDSSRIVSASGGLDWLILEPHPAEVKVWDARTGKEVLSLEGLTGDVNSVVFSGDARRIVTGSGGRDARGDSLPGEVKVWDATTGKLILTLKGHTSEVTCVAVSRSGKRLVSGSEDKTVKVWDATTGKEILTLKGHTAPVTRVAISNDGKRIVSGSRDQTVKAWDAQTGKEVFTYKWHSHWVNSVAISSDGSPIVSASADQTVLVWNPQTGKLALSLKGHGFGEGSVAISPDGKRTFGRSGDGTVKAWDAQTGKEVFTYQGHRHGVNSVAMSADGRRIVTGGVDKTVKIWDATSGTAPPYPQGAYVQCAQRGDQQGRQTHRQHLRRLAWAR